ncbi:MAG: DUF4349 domain-containing protein [Acidobacteria bacterium]|nr:DUF4349 domain-containing protein [Acidobacteriota bacterium]
MRAIQTYFFLTCLILTGGCNYSDKSGGFVNRASMPSSTPQVQAERERIIQGSGSPQYAQQGQQEGQAGANLAPAKSTNISLDSASSAKASIQAAERKIISNAEMIIETSTPGDGQGKISVIAAKYDGFIVTSESRENQGESISKPATTVTVVVRVPAAKFSEALEEIKQIGGRILLLRASGQDVTEEYIDLEARLRTKRALEMQFLEIMKQSRKISEALEVQNQLADVRTEIESLEGRRRFLENRSALSTINITLQTPLPLAVATTRGFGTSINAALGDGLDTATAIVLGVIHFLIVMIPVFLLILLPCWFLFKWLRHLIPWAKKSEPALSATGKAD